LKNYRFLFLNLAQTNHLHTLRGGFSSDSLSMSAWYNALKKNPALVLPPPNTVRVTPYSIDVPLLPPPLR